MKKKILMIVSGVVLVGGLVFGGLMLFRESLDYAGAERYVGEMLRQRGVVMKFLEEEVEGFEEIDRRKIVAFEGAVGRMEEYYKSLGASSAMKDEAIKTRYEGLQGAVEGFVEMRGIVQWLMGFVDVVRTEGFVGVLGEGLEEAPNDFVEGLMGDVRGYAEAVRGFEEKYKDGKTNDYAKMTEEYGAVVLKGKELEEKYGEVGMGEVVGISVENVEGYFEDLRTLRDVLEEKR